MKDFTQDANDHTQLKVQSLSHQPMSSSFDRNFSP